MAKKVLNKANLTALSTETLAGLVLEVTRGIAVLQRRLRLELSASEGPTDVARDIRKRFASIRRATGFLYRQRTLATELSDLVVLIEARVAPDAPGEAFDGGQVATDQKTDRGSNYARGFAVGRFLDGFM